MSERITIDMVPYILDQWDTEKNNVDASIVSVRNNEKFHWRCKKCGCMWEGTPLSRYNAKGKCPCCDAGRLIHPGYNDIFTLAPALKKSYDFDNNVGIDILHQGVSSTLRVHWKCDICGRKWQSMIISRVKKETDTYRVIECPHYNTVQRKPHEIPMVSENPNLMKHWDPENTIDPNTIKCTSQKKAMWLCPLCGYRWEATISSREKSTHKCPCCELKFVVKPGINDIFTLIPEAKLDYDFEKNKDIDISMHGVGSTQPIWWKCHVCGHTWQMNISTRVKREDGKYSLYSCQKCFHNDTSRIIAVASMPKLMRFWDFKKNHEIGLDPNTTSAHAKKQAFWRCEKCGYEWSVSIARRRISPDECPHCQSGYSKAIKRGKNDVLTLLPEIAEIYDFRKNDENGIDIYSLSIQSHVKAFFSCTKCGHKWESPISKRVKKTEYGTYRIVGCPNCNNLKLRKQTYAEQYPELDSMFNEKRNGTTLGLIKSKESASKKYWWTCIDGAHDFQASIQTMITARDTSTKGCPYCAKRRLVDGYSFADLHPELMDEYSPENTINPYNVFPHDKREVMWVCSDDPSHTWLASFSLRHLGHGKCPVCKRRKAEKGSNTFADKYPEYISQWSPNNEKKPDDVLYDSSAWYKWICPTCSNEYGAYIKTVLSDENACPYCSNRFVLPGVNSLAALHPDIIQRWSSNNGFTPDQVLATSKSYALWVCPICTGEYRAQINSIVDGNAKCPYCENKKPLPGYNSLAALHPELAKLWSHNNPKSADEVLPNRTTLAIWCCTKCGEEYTAPISNMVEGNHSCPYCDDRKVLPGHNSFAVKFPVLMEEWDYVNNYVLADPDMISDRCIIPVWWNCNNVSGHKYTMSPARRVEFQKRNRIACPECKGRRRKKLHFI